MNIAGLKGSTSWGSKGSLPWALPAQGPPEAHVMKKLAGNFCLTLVDLGFLPY